MKREMSSESIRSVLARVPRDTAKALIWAGGSRCAMTSTAKAVWKPAFIAHIKASWCVFVSFRRMGARIEQTSFALLGHSGHQLADTDYIDRSFDVVGQDLKGHFCPDIL